MEEKTPKTQEQEQAGPEPKSFRGALWDTLKFFLLAALIVLPVRLYIAQPFVVNGDSMVSTFQSGEYLIVDEISYRFREPMRGDVIILRYPRDPSKFFIKRIVGLPGETLFLKDGSVTVTNADNPEGFTLSEEYISSVRIGEFINITLEDDEYFVMGDNRKDSSDSRIWGPITDEHIVGRAFLRLFPVARANIFPGAVDFAPAVQ